MNFEITDKVDNQDEDAIHQGLLEYNLARLEALPKELGVYIRNDEGKIIAGLTGNTFGSWLTIKYLWVSEDLRGKCVGSQIIAEAENAAKSKGCKFSFVDTFSFQAPEFYKKQGYKEVFTLENYPITGKRYYYTKTL